MIGMDLDAKVKSAKPAGLVEEGTYQVRVAHFGRQMKDKKGEPIKDENGDTKVVLWEPVTLKDVMIPKVDDEGEIVRDDKNKYVKEKVKEYTFHKLNVALEILDGPEKGRYLYADLSTHLSVAFLIENFLYAVDVDECSLREIPELCVDKQLMVDVEHREYVVKKNDPTTGLPIEESKVAVNVGNFKKPELYLAIEETEEDEEDLGI